MPRYEHVKLDALNAADDVQPRAAGIDREIVEQYAAQMKGGAEFPSVVAYHDGTAYWLSEGFHRAAARRLAEFDTVYAEVRDGTKDDARWNALASNKTHGLMRSNQDKRRAVEMALAMRPGLSNRALAQHCGVSDVFVGKVREELSGANRLHLDGPRVGLDGKTYTANIGKASGDTPETPEPESDEPAVVEADPELAARPADLDELGLPIPPALAEVFAGRAAAAELVSLCRKLAAALDEFAKSPAGAHLRKRLSFRHRDGRESYRSPAVETLAGDIKSCTPHAAACPYCHHKHPGRSAKDCRACFGQGWTPAVIYAKASALPADFLAAVMGLAAGGEA